MVKPQGRHGEVAVELHTSFPERFSERPRLYALDARGMRREVRVCEAWPHKGRMVLKLEGVESISDAEALVGCELQIPQEERAPLQPGEAYVSDLVGCTLWAGEGGGPAAEIGRVTRVLFGAGEAPLLVVQAEHGELMVPFATEYLAGAGVDVGAGRVEMSLPAGMLELATPRKASAEKRSRRPGRRKTSAR